MDLDKPNAARVYDYLIGGKLNYAIDRDFAESLLAEMPHAREIGLANRGWLRRATRFGLEQGIRQFLDIGSGMPTEGHVHEVAQAVDPAARVVYVDNEPVAVAHSEIVLENNENAAMVMADGERPEDIIDHPVTRSLIDFSRPVMLIMAAFVHFIPESRDPAGLISRYRAALAPGSLLALSSDTAERQDPEMVARGLELYKRSTHPITLRTSDQLRTLVRGFEIVDPGVVFTSEWRADEVVEHPESAGILALVGRR